MHKELVKFNKALNSFHPESLKKVVVAQKKNFTFSITFFNRYPDEGKPRNDTVSDTLTGIPKIKYLDKFNETFARLMKGKVALKGVLLDEDGYVFLYSKNSKTIRLSEGEYMSTGIKYRKEKF